MYSADLRAVAVPTATGADDCHAPERNVRNDEMSNWIGVGLVVIGDVGWPTVSLVTDSCGGGRKKRLRDKISVDLKFGLNV